MNENMLDLTVNRKESWAIFDELEPSYRGYLRKLTENARTLNQAFTSAVWKKIGFISAFRESQSSYSWLDFQPLRKSQSKEPDYSDWLAFIMRTAPSGLFSHEILGQFEKHASWEPENISREETTEGYRSDLLIYWQEKHVTHIEVKIGDLSMRKTFDEAVKIRQRFKKENKSTSHFMLILDNQKTQWDAELNQSANIKTLSQEGLRIETLLWSDIAVALRKTFSKVANEKSDIFIVWAVWAYAFLNAIEANLLDCPEALLSADSPDFESISRLEKILSRCLR